MPISKTSKRYAKALFELAAERGRTAVVLADLKSILTAVETTPDLNSFLCDYMARRDVQLKILEAVLKARVDTLTWRFIGFLAFKKRLPVLADVCRAFGELYDRSTGILRAELVTPFTGERSTEASVRIKLRDMFRRDIDLAVSEDKALIGGFMMKIGDLVYDLSAAGALAAARKKLING